MSANSIFHILDGLVAPFWLGVTFLLGLAAWRLGGAFFPKDGPAERTAHCIVLGWAGIASSSTVLGLAKSINYFSLLAGVASVSGLLLLADRHARKRRVILNNIKTNNSIQNDLISWNGWTVLWIFMGFWAMMHVAINGIGKYPDDWDSMNYHIPMIDQWLHARSLYAPASDHWQTPGNNEVIGLWMVSPFSGDFLIGLTNMPSVVLLACSAFGISTQLRLTRALKNVAASTILVNGVVIKQLVDQENDVAVAALFLCVLFYALRYTNDQKSYDIFMSAVVLGLLSGVKYYALGYAAIAFLALVGLVRIEKGTRACMNAATILCGGFIAWGGYWYIRNYLISGSPFYPLMSTFSDQGDVLPRKHASVWATTLYGHRSLYVISLYATKVLVWMGPLQLLAFVMLPISTTWLVFGGVRQWRFMGLRQDGIIRIVLGSLLAASGAVLSITPFAVGNSPNSWDALRTGYAPTRYGLGFISLSVLGAVVVLQDIGVSLCRAVSKYVSPRTCSILRGKFESGFSITVAAVILISLYAVCVPPPETTAGSLVVPLVLAVDCVVITIIVRRLRKTHRKYLMPPTLALACGLSSLMIGVGWLSREWHTGFIPYYEALFGTDVFSIIEKKSSPTSRIAILVDRPYPFFGSSRQFEIFQPLPVQRQPTYPWLLQALREEDIDLVAIRYVYKDQESRFQNIDEWASNSPTFFVPVLRDHRVSLYRVNKVVLKGQESSASPFSPPLFSESSQ